MACQVVFLPPRIVWIKGLVFFYERPGDMEQLPSGGTPSHFLWLPGRAQPAIEGLDDGVMLHGTQRRHIQCGPQAAVAGMPNGRSVPHTRAGLPWHGCQPGIGREGFHGVTRRKVEGGHQRPRRGYPTDAYDTLQALRGSSPRGVLAECSCDFRLDLGELGLENHQQVLHPCTHLRNDLRMLPQGMELVVYLLAEVEQVIPLGQPLL